MDLIDAIRTNPTTREFKPDPVPDEVLARVLDAARFAPTGGNRQPVRFVVVREPETKRRLRDLYLPHWKAYIGAIPPEKKAADPKLAWLVERADRFAETLDRVPVMLPSSRTSSRRTRSSVASRSSAAARSIRRCRTYSSPAARRGSDPR
jgi:nitroreductase